LAQEDLARLDDMADRLSLQAGEPLIHEGDPATSVYNITAGSVRVYKLLPEAIEDAALCRFDRDAYRALTRERPVLEGALLDRAMHDLAAAQSQMLLLGRKTARERLASFLLDMPDRDPARPQIDHLVHLPMTRSEIADYLGLTIETVSRELTKLRTAGIVTLLSLHWLRIDQPARLKDMAEGL
jgi:CRP/FNR family transcriptional regulator